MKREAGRIHLIGKMPSPHTSNGRVKDPETVANAFNNFLLTITGNSKLYKVWRKYIISFLKMHFL
jgi:hypothetical protein